MAKAPYFASLRVQPYPYKTQVSVFNVVSLSGRSLSLWDVALIVQFRGMLQMKLLGYTEKIKWAECSP